LREKQKAKRLYSVLESQFARYYKTAIKSPQNTGEVLLQLLETRLDNLVYKFSFTQSRSLARQLVTHGNVLVDGKKLDIASYNVKPGQTISLSSKGQKLNHVTEAMAKPSPLPKWLERKAMVGKLSRLPNREEIDVDIKDNLIVEYYSR
ncbi:30S ribosomal protein S4, partial [Candidatus Collierbacteria bacterium]|nr:30S ribosomal protein S4 [Candidatus Collierbacteria bacterium]